METPRGRRIARQGRSMYVGLGNVEGVSPAEVYIAGIAKERES
jgi:hypothetical protein